MPKLELKLNKLWWRNRTSAFSYVKKKGKGTLGSHWGSWRYLGEPKNWINPHEYWAGGKGKPECFVDNKEYLEGLLTLPIRCEDL